MGVWVDEEEEILSTKSEIRNNIKLTKSQISKQYKTCSRVLEHATQKNGGHGSTMLTAGGFDKDTGPVGQGKRPLYFYI